MTLQDEARSGGPVSVDRGAWFPLLILAPVAGAMAGVLGAAFRWSLDAADAWRIVLAEWGKGTGAVGVVALILVCAACSAVAAWLVRRYAREASGSGIPHIEAVLRRELPQASIRLIPVKFVGGVLAIGSGLALGREGPSVQMGATSAHLLGRLFRCNWDDCRVLLAAGAGAGLATAFNAPLGGAIFVLEELVRRFETRIAIAALAASAAAIAVSRSMLGNSPDFVVAALPDPGSAAMPAYVLLGAACGLAAVGYNRTILAALDLAERLRRVPVEGRAAAIGGIVGLAVWLMPDLVGGGDPLTQNALLGQGTIAAVAVLFILRFGLGALSYAAATPGGLFAPLLVLGAQLGLVFGLAFQTILPDWSADPRGFALVGMAALFTGVVRAPLTGIVLVAEMTANTNMLLPILCACFAAMLVPTFLRDPPIYDSLRERTVRQQSGSGNVAGQKAMTPDG